jgi:hypothetical protein
MPQTNTSSQSQCVDGKRPHCDRQESWPPFRHMSTRVARLRPCPSLDQHFESRLDEIRDDQGNERNTSLAWITLFRHSNDHGVILLLGPVKSYKDLACRASAHRDWRLLWWVLRARERLAVSNKSLTFRLRCTFRKPGVLLWGSL